MPGNIVVGRTDLFHGAFDYLLVAPLTGDAAMHRPGACKRCRSDWLREVGDQIARLVDG